MVVCPTVFCTSETAGSEDSCEEEGEEGFMNIGTVIKEYGAVNINSEYSTVSDTY